MDANLELSKQNICSRVLAEMLLLNENISGSTTRLQQSIKLDYLGNVKVRNRTRRGLGETQLQELGKWRNINAIQNIPTQMKHHKYQEHITFH
ncbi:PREDICTED: uncharacterized protein LOC109215616 isoform X2 [Nicotiana attenuata]|uniref:uncharacterized protein LOC109215616 isoform X2 n=1 Tax=Nicotiana attenuata TaxID=49451 RepID=UPI000904ED97|nr:PREDICTED: uncharacterized protein LOC109215616 isoform X2 [Nicotiana attenuata]